MLDEYEQVKRRHAAMKRVVEDRRAAHLAALSRLKDEFDVDSVEAAEALLVKLRKKEKAAADADYQAKQELKTLEASLGTALAEFLGESS